MAENEVDKLAGNLNDLNKVSLKAGLEFKGLTKRLITMSDSVSGAGQKWTIFSRIVSGSPIWKLQNKIRAFVDSLALLEQASQKNLEAQKKANSEIIDTVKSYKKLQEPLEQLRKFRKTENFQNEKLLKSQLEKNEAMREAIENSVEYNKAILLGDTEFEAIKKATKALTEKGKEQEEQFKVAQKTAKFAEGLKIRDLSDPEEKKKRKEGMKEARSQVKDARKKAKAGFSLFGASNFGGKKDPMGKRLKKLVKQGKRRLRFDRTRMKLANFSLRYQKFMLGVGKMARPVLNYAFKVLVMVMLGIVAFLAFAKIAYEAFGFIQEFGVLEDLKRIGFLVLDTAKSIIGMIMAVVNGDIYKFIEHGEKIVKNIIAIGILAVAAILKTLFALAVGAFYSIIDFIEKLKGDKDLRNKVFEILMKAGLLLLAAYFIKYLAIKLMEIAAIYALPVLIGVLLIAGITALLYKIVKDFKIGNAFKAAKEGVKNFLGGAKDKVMGAFADGGTVSQSGLQLVGEKGPELVKLPAGSRVHTNGASKKMMGHTINNTFNITVHGGLPNVPKLAEQLGKEIGNKITRRISSSGLFR